MINDPQQLNEKYIDLSSVYATWVFPKDMDEKILKSFALWDDEYAFKAWGYDRQQGNSTGSWTASEAEKWNNNYNALVILLQAGTKDPRSKKAAGKKTPTGTNKPVELEPVNLFGNQGWYWIVGSIGLLGIVVAALGKKEHPVLTEFNSRKRHGLSGFGSPEQDIKQLEFRKQIYLKALNRADDSYRREQIMKNIQYVTRQIHEKRADLILGKEYKW